MLDYDIRHILAWAFSQDGFEYPEQGDAKKNCSGHLHNDLLWEPWEVRQCMSRLGSKKHTKLQPICCEMFNSQPSGKCDSDVKRAYTLQYFFDNDLKKMSKKCDWSREWRDFDTSANAFKCRSYREAPYFIQKAGPNLNRRVIKRHQTLGRYTGELVCGFVYRYGKPET